MMIGHAALAFAVVATVARRRVDDRRALVLAVLAAAFATVPDADMTYALVGLLHADYGSVFSVTRSFWGASTAVHRAMTHSLVVAVPAAAAFALWGVRADVDGRPLEREWRLGRGRTRTALARAASLALLAGLFVVSWETTGPLAVVVMTAFVGAGLAVATVARRRTGVRPVELFAVALFGLASHPWGDLFTGHPPQMLYPLDRAVFASRVALSGDPTLNLLGAFAVELATLWLATLAYRRLRDDHVFSLGDPKAALGAGYALAALVLPPPSLALSYQFVFSILSVGAVVAVPNVARPTLPRLRTDEVGGRTLGGVLELHLNVEGARGAWVTALQAVTVALVAYGLGYLLF